MLVVALVAAAAASVSVAAAAAASVYCGVIYVRLVAAISARRQCTVGGSERKMSQAMPSQASILSHRARYKV